MSSRRRIRESQIVMIPGGFSGGDEPDGSAKFITAFFRAPEVTEAVRDLLQARDGLMLGICNGFQALVKLGLVPYGDIVDATPDCAYADLQHHRPPPEPSGAHARRVQPLALALRSARWAISYTVAISHGEGRFVANDEALRTLVANGQVATQYVDEAGMPTMDLDVNPNGSGARHRGHHQPRRPRVRQDGSRGAPR